MFYWSELANSIRTWIKRPMHTSTKKGFRSDFRDPWVLLEITEVCFVFKMRARGCTGSPDSFIVSFSLEHEKERAHEWGITGDKRIWISFNEYTMSVWRCEGLPQVRIFIYYWGNFCLCHMNLHISWQFTITTKQNQWKQHAKSNDKSPHKRSKPPTKETL